MIYLVEDDSSIRGLVEYTLNNSGLPTKGFESAEPFWAAMKEELPSLILLDIMLPGEYGLHILKRIREKSAYSNIPVIMLTAKTTEYDRVIGLDSGADDYISKPFSMMELISRVKALLRRMGRLLHMSLDYKDLHLDPDNYKVTAAGADVTLTLKEFELLKLLLKNKGTVMTRDRIIETVWGYDFDGETRTVDVHIRTLRTKLGEAGAYIETVRGIGYRIGD